MVHPPSRFSPTASPPRRFTLIELLVAMAVVAILAAWRCPRAAPTCSARACRRRWTA
ncbi:MAG: prepilin-type N-terminal cleavage/methylation domain-containing protein [Rubrivivax sp.]